MPPQIVCPVHTGNQDQRRGMVFSNRFDQQSGPRLPYRHWHAMRFAEDIEEDRRLIAVAAGELPPKLDGCVVRERRHEIRYARPNRSRESYGYRATAAPEPCRRRALPQTPRRDPALRDMGRRQGPTPD